MSEDYGQALDNTVQAIYTLSAELNQLVLQLERIPGLPVAPEQPDVPTKSSAPPVLRYPVNVNHIVVDWLVLRMVVASKLAKLIKDGTYKPRVKTDLGHGWLASQWGVSSHTVREFLVSDRIMGAEIFLRAVKWTGEPVESFLVGDDDGA